MTEEKKTRRPRATGELAVLGKVGELLASLEREEAKRVLKYHADRAGFSLVEKDDGEE